MINVADKYALDMSGATDNASKLAQLARDIGAIYVAQGPMPRLTFPEGIVAFSAWPDLAYPDLQIVADGNCQLRSIGPGDAITFDASKRNPGAVQPGIRNLTFVGFDVQPGAVGAALSLRGIHRSDISVRVLRGTYKTRAAIEMLFCIVTRIHPVVEASNSVGLWIDAWPNKPNLQSTAVTIDRPCLENCAVGLQMASAGSCFAYGGTIESCGTGVILDQAGYNIFKAVEMEGNGMDVQATSAAKGNSFEGCGNDGKLNTNFSWFSTNRVQ